MTVAKFFRLFNYLALITSDLCPICRNNCLFVVDAVATLGACDLYVDEYKIDACFSTSQKVLGGPAGLAPVTLSSRAMDAIENRKTPSNVYFYDAVYLSELFKCTDKPRR